MTTKKKSSLHLVEGKEKEYEIVTVYIMDEFFEFSLLEWEMWESDEWIQFRKKDKAALECFSIQSISHISFVNKGGKPIVSGVSKPILKPVA